MTNKLLKSVAMALAAITFSLPFGTQALAASHHDASQSRPKQKVEQRHDQHRTQSQAHKQNQGQMHKAPAHQAHPNMHRAPAHNSHPVVHRAPAHRNHPNYRPAHYPYERSHHSATGNFVTGAIIGAIIGAVVANNS